MSDNTKLTGKIVCSENGKEASLIIPIDDYRIMILSDDSCSGDGIIRRSELYVYHKDNKPSQSINEEIFDRNEVMADSETLHEVIAYCQRMLKKKLLRRS